MKINIIDNLSSDKVFDLRQAAEEKDKEQFARDRKLWFMTMAILVIQFIASALTFRFMHLTDSARVMVCGLIVILISLMLIVVNKMFTPANEESGKLNDLLDRIESLEATDFESVLDIREYRENELTLMRVTEDKRVVPDSKTIKFDNASMRTDIEEMQIVIDEKGITVETPYVK